MKVRVVLTVDVDPDVWREDMGIEDNLTTREDIREWVVAHVVGTLAHLCPDAKVR